MKNKMNVVLCFAATAAIMVASAVSSFAAFVPSVSQSVQAGAEVVTSTGEVVSVGVVSSTASVEEFMASPDPAVMVAASTTDNAVYQTLQKAANTEELLATLGVDAVVEDANSYQAAGIYEINYNTAAVSVVGENGAISVTMEMPGVSAGDSVLVVCVVNGKSTVVKATVNAEGKIQFTAPNNATVMIMKKV